MCVGISHDVYGRVRRARRVRAGRAGQLVPSGSSGSSGMSVARGIDGTCGTQQRDVCVRVRVVTSVCV